MKSSKVLAVLAMLAMPLPALAGDASRAVTLYKTPQCSCCDEYADYLRANSFDVTVVPTHDLSSIKREHGVPDALEGCHTSVVDGYVVEGHVPVNTLNKLLTERPRIRGIALPGMPLGSPGMSGRKEGPFTMYVIGEGQTRVFAVE
jgi:hypothetical protein